MEKLESVATVPELSDGVSELIVGSVSSAVVNVQVVSSAIPANELPLLSSKAVVSIWM